MGQWKDFFIWMTANYGVLVTMVIIFNGFIIFLWWGERQDRKAAWSAHNKSLEQMLKVVGENTSILETIKVLLIKG